MKNKDNNIVYLKTKDGHRIWTFKELINGYKYFGIYKKPIQLNKQEDKKNGI